MAAEEEAERRLFVAEPLFLAPLVEIGQFLELRRPSRALRVAEKIRLPTLPLALQALAEVEGRDRSSHTAETAALQRSPRRPT